MERFLSLAAGAAAVSALGVLLKKERPEFGLFLSVGWLLVLSGWAAVRMISVVAGIGEMALEAGIESGYMRLMLRCIGISLLSGIAETVCKESGQLSAAAGIGLAGKVLILESCLPVYRALFSLVLSLIGEG